MHCKPLLSHCGSLSLPLLVLEAIVDLTGSGGLADLSRHDDVLLTLLPFVETSWPDRQTEKKKKTPSFPHEVDIHGDDFLGRFSISSQHFTRIDIRCYAFIC